jgi:hypothetical protein
MTLIPGNENWLFEVQGVEVTKVFFLANLRRSKEIPYLKELMYNILGNRILPEITVITYPLTLILSTHFQ